jgi:tRNA(His) 5'-end guanylyltransferase
MASIDFQSLGDEQKKLELISAGARLVSGVPVIARLDGRAFHTLTKDANKPFDCRIVGSMEHTAKTLVEAFQPDVGYTQSDEITLVWESMNMFDGRIQKICSTLASYASVIFAKEMDQYQFPIPRGIVPTFDCRVWHVPSLSSAVDNLTWREWDASKNSVSMCAHTKFTNVQLKGVPTKRRVQMLYEVGFDWNGLADNFKRGSYWQRKTFMEFLTEEECERIPAQHRPAGAISRSRVVRMNFPRLVQVSNPVGMIFRAEEPQLRDVIGIE